MVQHRLLAIDRDCITADLSFESLAYIKNLDEQLIVMLLFANISINLFMGAMQFITDKKPYAK